MSTSISDRHLSDLVVKHAHQNFVRLSVGETVVEALRRVQNSRVEGRIIYFYVVDSQDRLQGVIPTRRLLLESAPDAAGRHHGAAGHCPSGDGHAAGGM